MMIVSDYAIGDASENMISISLLSRGCQAHRTINLTCIPVCFSSYTAWVLVTFFFIETVFEVISNQQGGFGTGWFGVWLAKLEVGAPGLLVFQTSEYISAGQCGNAPKCMALNFLIFTGIEKPQSLSSDSYFI